MRRLKKARAETDAAIAELDALRVDLERALDYAAERDALAERAGTLLADRQARVVELEQTVRDRDLALAVLAKRLGEIEAYRRQLRSRDEGHAAPAPLPDLRFGRVGAVYVHKMDGHQIVLLERTGASEWRYQYVGIGQAVWHIFEEDLADQYTAVAEESIALRLGGGS